MVVDPASRVKQNLGSYIIGSNQSSGKAKFIKSQVEELRSGPVMSRLLQR